MRIHKANPHASLRMTALFGRTAAAQAALLICPLDAALKRRSSTVLLGSVAAPAKIKVKIKITIKIKGVGQEYPTHTGKILPCMPTKVGSTFVDFTSSQERGKVE
jgi:hypothetical protein